VNKDELTQWRRNFLTGLAIVLPAVISLAVVAWVFGTVSNITDTLLIFLPRRWTHQPDAMGREGAGPMHWYWSLFALMLAVFLIALVGRSARHYAGKKMIQLVDYGMLRIPLLNKIYVAIKQVNEAFTSSNKTSFKQVVLVEFPRQGIYSVGFITGEDHKEVQEKTLEKIVSIFVPTTPNPTTGFLILVPEDKVIRLQMPVSDGIKFIISLGSVSPIYTSRGEFEAAAQPVLTQTIQVPEEKVTREG
jgi:uncharacterized membrane protein